MTRRRKSNLQGPFRPSSLVPLLAATLFLLVAAVFMLGNGLRETWSNPAASAVSKQADHTADTSSDRSKSPVPTSVARSKAQDEFRTHDKCIDAEEACLPPEPPPMLPLSGVRIMLDAGHGGIDTGAIRDGINEKDINLTVTLKLRDVLVKQGATVILTRDSDVALTLDERKALIALHAPTLFVSVHSNANTNPAIDGIEAYYYNDASDMLAQSIYQAVIDGLGERGNWVRKRELAVVHHELSPAALIEIGYLSNDKVRSSLVKDDYQNQVAESIYKGILDYVLSQSGLTPPPPPADKASLVFHEQPRSEVMSPAKSASALKPRRAYLGPAPLVQR